MTKFRDKTMTLFAGNINNGVTTILYSGKTHYSFNNEGEKLYRFSGYVRLNCSLEEAVSKKIHYLAIYPDLETSSYCYTDVIGEVKLSD